MGNKSARLDSKDKTFGRLFMPALNRGLFRQMINLNFSDVDVYPVFNFNPLTELDRRTMAQTFDLLIKNNVVSPVETWVRELLKLPDADPETIKALEAAWIASAAGGSSPFALTAS